MNAPDGRSTVSAAGEPIKALIDAKRAGFLEWLGDPELDADHPESEEQWAERLLRHLSDRGYTLAAVSPAGPEPLPHDVLRADVEAMRSGYPMEDGRPLGMGGRAFEQCREAVLRLIDRASPGIDIDRLARAIEAEDERLPFLDAGIDSTATPRAVAEQIATEYARLTREAQSKEPTE